MRRLRVTAVALAAALAAAVAVPGSASAHAVLERTEPARGAALDSAPAAVGFEFNEPVELGLGSIRVFDAEGDELDSGEPGHPGGRGESIAADLPADLADGTYTATFRVISADGHPVSGGFVFSFGASRAAPEASVSELVDDEAGAVTDVVFAIARTLSYLALAIAAGAAIFLAAVWAPALRRVEPESIASGAAPPFSARLRMLVPGAAIAGIAGTVLGLLAEGSLASGAGIGDAVDPSVLADVLETRFGQAWAARIPIWLALGALALRAGAGPIRRGASLAGWTLVAALLATVPLAGHAATQDPTAVLIPADLVHVTSMSAWVGGLVILVAALPAATRAIDPGERTRLLAAVLPRFSALALVSVAALLATGILQSLLELDSVDALFETWFGRLILIKAGLLSILIGFGAYNRRRSVPRIRALAERGATPGAVGVRLRATLRGEVALAAVVIAVASLLVAETPQSSAPGPQSGSVEKAGTRLDYTVEPAEPGSNEIHLYLTDAGTGSPVPARSAEAEASMPESEIGPIPIELRRAGPGHFTAPRAALGVRGDWTIAVEALVSRFDQVEAEFEVEVGS